jgi:hypothetical protein
MITRLELRRVCPVAVTLLQDTHVQQFQMGMDRSDGVLAVVC